MQDTQYQAYGKHVLVQLIKRPTTTASGLHLPESSRQDELIEGVVVNTGEISNKHYLLPNDHVVFPKHAGRMFTDNGVEYYIIHEDQIVVYCSKQTVYTD